MRVDERQEAPAHPAVQRTAADGVLPMPRSPSMSTSLQLPPASSQFAAGHGFYAIAEGLTRDGIPSPSAHDPERNKHRSGIAWNKFAVRSILINPRYTDRRGRPGWLTAPSSGRWAGVAGTG